MAVAPVAPASPRLPAGTMTVDGVPAETSKLAAAPTMVSVRVSPSAPPRRRPLGMPPRPTLLV